MHTWRRPSSWATFITRCQTLQHSRCGSGFTGYIQNLSAESHSASRTLQPKTYLHRTGVNNTEPIELIENITIYIITNVHLHLATKLEIYTKNVFLFFFWGRGSCVCVCVCVCVSIHICMYICMYICLYVIVFSQANVQSCRSRHLGSKPLS